MSNLKKIGIAACVFVLFVIVCFSIMMVGFKQDVEHKVPEYNKHLTALEEDADEMDLLFNKAISVTDPTYQRLKADAKIHADAAEVLARSIRTNTFFWSSYRDGRENNAEPMLSREGLQCRHRRFIETK